MHYFPKSLALSKHPSVYLYQMPLLKDFSVCSQSSIKLWNKLAILMVERVFRVWYNFQWRNETCVTVAILYKMVTQTCPCRIPSAISFKCQVQQGSRKMKKMKRMYSSIYCKILKSSWVNPYSSPADLKAIATGN